MKFCDKCGNLMLPEKKKGKMMYTCRTCGHVSYGEKAASATVIEEKIPEEKKVIVMVEDETFKQYPKTKIICPECDNNEAYWYMQQTRAADEPPTRFYCCTKCGHKWREY
jgi:DNA-directed RNA polymerase subunit M